MRKAKSSINTEKLFTSAEILRAIAHPLRMKILGFIDQNENINVNKIYNTMKLEQSITSQHLRVLRAAGLVSTEKNGKFRHYNVNYQKVTQVLSAINNFETN
ncbi:MAG: helix-turn-helix transcriptional regulator [Saprospiraceae bacterium]|nr:helix-turn-helix transcriptional regulator [Saprospiraceae bacterium]